MTEEQQSALMSMNDGAVLETSTKPGVSGHGADLAYGPELIGVLGKSDFEALKASGYIELRETYPRGTWTREIYKISQAGKAIFK